MERRRSGRWWRERAEHEGGEVGRKKRMKSVGKKKRMKSVGRKKWWWGGVWGGHSAD